MKRFERLLAVIGAAALLVAGSAVATEASNGSTIKFGKTNKGSKTTTLQVTSGAASPLKLSGKATSAPLVTNMTGQVANLNASMVGGVSLVPKVFRVPTPVLDFQPYDVPGIVAGTYLVTLAANLQVGLDTEYGCWLYDTDTRQIVLEMHSVSSGGAFYSSPSASTVAVIDGTPMTFECDTSSGSATVPTGYYTGFAPTIGFVPLPSTTVSTLAP